MSADQTYQAGVYFRRGGNEAVVAAGGSITSDYGGGAEFNVRIRVPIAGVNAGATILAAALGVKFRLTGIRAIAVGGAVGAVTTVDVLGTQATASVKLASFAQASLTQSALLSAGGSGAAILADGASFATNDSNTPITVNITGSAATTATNIDFLLSYCVEFG